MHVRDESMGVIKFRTVHCALSTKHMQLCYMYASRATPSRPPAHHCGGAERRRSGGRGGRASRCMASCKMQAHHAYMYMYCIRAQRVIKLQVMYQAPGLVTVLKNKYTPPCMVHRRRIRKKIPNCLPAEASIISCYAYTPYRAETPDKTYMSD